MRGRTAALDARGDVAALARAARTGDDARGGRRARRRRRRAARARGRG